MPGCFYDAGVKGNQVQNLSDPVTVNRELSANYHCTDRICHSAIKRDDESILYEKVWNSVDL